MNALLINIPLNDLGQPASVQGDSGPKSGETAFADILSAAMVGAMHTAAMSDQNGRVESTGLADGNSVTPKGPAVEPALPAARRQLTNAEAQAGNFELGSNQEGARQRNLLNAAGLEAIPLHSLRGAAADQDGEGLAARNTAQVTPIDGDHVGGKPLGPLATATAALSVQQASQQAAATPAEHSRNVDRLADGAPALANSHRPAMTTRTEEPVIAAREAVSVNPEGTVDPGIARATEHVKAALGPVQTASDGNQLLAEPPDRMPSTSDQDSFLIHSSLLNQAARRSDQAVPDQGPLASTERDPAIGQTPADSKFAQLQRTVDIPPNPSAVSRQRDITDPLASKPESVVNSSKPSSHYRPAEPRTAAVTAPHYPQNADQFADQPRPANGLSADQRPQRSPAPASEAGQKPAATALQPVGPVQTTAAEAGPLERVGLAGLDLSHDMPTVEGPLLDGDRLDATNSVSAARSSSPASQPTPGAQIGLQIARSLSNGVERLTVHLHPAELGSVDIQLSFEGAGKVSAQIIAERPETLELLQRDSRILERSLGDSGLKLSNDGLSFSLKQDHQQQQQGHGFQEQQREWQERSPAHRAYDKMLDEEGAASPVRVESLRLLDIET